MKRIFGGSPEKKRAEQVGDQLVDVATSAIAVPDFEKSNALIQAYAVALGVTVPEHVKKAAFPDKLFPKWDDVIWRKDFSVFLDLASVLAWRQCLGAFSDLDGILKPEHVEQGWQTLMRIAGTVYPVSDRAESLMHRYHTYERDPEATREFFKDTPLWDIGTGEHPPKLTHIEIHAWMINATLGEPSLYFADPADSFALTLYLAGIELAATRYFKQRALDLFSKHLAAGRP
jgi:hypothetical protein